MVISDVMVICDVRSLDTIAALNWFNCDKLCMMHLHNFKKHLG